MKKLTTKLLISVIAVVLALTTLGTSTFAWFTMNQQVTATGMSVKASASGGLYIATYSNTNVGSFAPTANAVSASADSLSPVSTADCTNWYTAVAKNSGNYEAEQTQYSKVTSSNGYYLVNSFIIKTSDGSAMTGKNLTVNSMTITGETLSANLNDSLRVVLVTYKEFNTETKNYTGTTTNFFAPLYTEKVTLDSNKTVVESVTFDQTSGKSTGITTKQLSTIYGGDFGSVNIESGTVSGYTKVDVFVYYEGMDSNCFADNVAQGIDTLSLELTFTVTNAN